MKQFSVIIMGIDEERRAVLGRHVEETTSARLAQTIPSFPLGSSDSALRHLQSAAADLVIVDIPRQSPGSAFRAIEVLRAAAPQTSVVAIGDASLPQVIIGAMRAGACEFLEWPISTEQLLEAFGRIAAVQRKTELPGHRGRVFTLVNAKGGSGATTLAVNLASTLQSSSGGVVLVDLAPLGHTALHLNITPSFTIVDAIRNLHRLDQSLLESYLTRCQNGLQLLSGATRPLTDELANANLAHLFDLLVSRFNYVVVDASSRLDRSMRLVCDLSDAVLVAVQTDLASLWSAVRVQEFLNETVDASRLRLVINRFRKIPGFSEADIESATRMKMIAKIPNQYSEVAAGIDRGVPVTQQNRSEMARAFAEVVERLQELRPEKSKISPLLGVA